MKNKKSFLWTICLKQFYVYLLQFFSSSSSLIYESREFFYCSIHFFTNNLMIFLALYVWNLIWSCNFSALICSLLSASSNWFFIYLFFGFLLSFFILFFHRLASWWHRGGATYVVSTRVDCGADRTCSFSTSSSFLCLFSLLNRWVKCSWTPLQQIIAYIKININIIGFDLIAHIKRRKEED